MKFLKYELQLDPSDAVEVSLDGQANVQLMDWSNFNNYKNGKSYCYYGGLQKVSPAVLVPPYAGHWYLAVDLGGYVGEVNVGVEIVKR